MAAYLFAHFTTEKHGGEQVYFSVSRDGLHWQDLHGGQPVLRSGISTKGVRDPFIVRHPLTGMYHLMATDLCIITCKDGWHGAKHAGSRNMIVWDSPDLVHWSPPRAVTVAPENAGCAWAPEAVWDQEKQAFFVFFAPYTEENGESAGSGKLRIYASYTKDFLTFTPPFRYIEHERSVIDTTIVWTDGIYYRFSKDEATKSIRVDKGDTLMADFTPVQCPVLDAMMGLEGPECYQLPDGRWCLICDQFAARKGYLPIIIDDLRTMQPVILREDEYDFGRTLKRHGGVIRIEENDYQRLINHYGINGGMMMYTLDLRHTPPKEICPLGDKFRGTSPDGHEISFTNYAMMVNQKPFFGISGEMHFCRVAPDQWEDAVLKMKAGGINIISTYVFWIVHEEEEGVFRFDGCRDVRRFLEICEKHGMMVIMRVGPFCHGEFRNGGLPDWLYGKPFDVRDDNPGFLDATRKFFRALHGQMDGHYFSQGGCIVAAQIENEYQHSSAPWEITTGISSEWVNGGKSGEAYMVALKKIMQEEGIVTPFYTTTAWGGAITPVEEALPLWGGYSYQPWIFYNRTGEHPATPEYIYRDNHSNANPKTYNFEPTYAPESRPYACCEMMGGMMCSYNYRFQMDMRAIDALANTKLGSGCNLLGYYMYKGGTNPTGARTPYLNESQVSKRSYDYQAALGEFGQVRESYGRLKALHLFCQTFADVLAEAKTVLPEHMHDLQPDDLGPLRWCVRVKGNEGFLFVNNFQDHIAMVDRKNECVTLQTPSGDLTFRFDIAAGENAVLPFGVMLGDVRLDWATAMPMTHIGDTWFFMVPDGMKPVYCIGDVDYAPASGEVLQVNGMTIVTLTRAEANQFYLLGGKAYLCDKPLVLADNVLKAETDDGCVTLREWADGAWQTRTLGEKRELVQAAFRKVGIGRYVVDVPQDALRGHKQVLLRVSYVGDIGHAFINGQMISDNFANGAAWDIRLDCYADELAANPLTIYITPTKEHVTVDVSSAMAGRMEKATGLKAELLDEEILPVDEVIFA